VDRIYDPAAVAETLVDELRSRIEWIDGHADVWAGFADATLFDRCVEAGPDCRVLVVDDWFGQVRNLMRHER
jgi:hypothetical protein